MIAAVFSEDWMRGFTSALALSMLLNEFSSWYRGRRRWKKHLQKNPGLVDKINEIAKIKREATKGE